MKDHDFYMKLVDLYAGGELPQELEDEMTWSSMGDQALSHEMNSLRRTVELIRELPDAEYTEESHQRILMKLYARGAAVQPASPEPSHLQYHLPMQG